MADFLDHPTKGETPPPVDRRAGAASEIAKPAGKIALDCFERVEVSWKADDSMVTEAFGRDSSVRLITVLLRTGRVRVAAGIAVGQAVRRIRPPVMIA